MLTTILLDSQSCSSSSTPLSILLFFY